MGAVRRSRALCARPDSGGQDLLGVSQPQTTGDGRLFQRKIVGAATMPSRGRGGAPSWPEVRDESLCPGGASPPDSGRKAYCPGKRRPVLPDAMTGEGDAAEGACDGGTVARKAGKKSGEGDAADSAHGGVAGLQALVGSVSRGWKDAAGSWKCRRARKIFTRTKARNATTEVVAFLEKGVEAPMAFVNAQTLQSGRSKAEGKKTSLRLRCGPACQRPSGRTWWWSRKTRIPELLRSPAW